MKILQSYIPSLTWPHQETPKPRGLWRVRSGRGRHTWARKKRSNLFWRRKRSNLFWRKRNVSIFSEGEKTLQFVLKRKKNVLIHFDGEKDVSIRFKIIFKNRSRNILCLKTDRHKSWLKNQRKINIAILFHLLSHKK